MSRHTREPWRSKRHSNSIVGIHNIYNGASTGADIVQVCQPRGRVEQEANAARIVACVNALAGIAKPEEWVAAARELMLGLEQNGSIAVGPWTQPLLDRIIAAEQFTIPPQAL